MTERETARRTFAREFNDATLTYGEHTDRTPNFVVTPTGAMCNRIFAVGVLTEVENIGSQGQTLYRARLADPTGAFTIYAGQYQPEAATFLSGAEPPAYVAVSGKVRLFSPEPGVSYTSIRPEEINIVDRSVRDRWIYHTAALTLDRIKIVEKALASGFRGEELTWHLIQATEDASGVSRAIDHYQLSHNMLQAYKQMVVNALSTIVEPVTAEGQETDLGEVIIETIDRLDSGEGAKHEDILNALRNRGYEQEAVEAAINALLGEGRCYEPKIGLIKSI
jgi:RPA family protein